MTRKYYETDQAMTYRGDGKLASRAIFAPNSTTEQHVTYSYDLFGRPSTITYPGADGSISYGYDGFGRRTGVTDNRSSSDNIGGSHAIDYDYDALGRLICVTDQDGYKTSYTYRADGQKTSLQVDAPNNQLLYRAFHAYDRAGQLTKLRQHEDAERDIAQLTYDNNGSRQSITYKAVAGDVALTYRYNPDSFLTSYNKLTAGPSGLQFAFDADPAGSQSGDTFDGRIDGLGRLVTGRDILTTPGQTPNIVTYTHNYSYDLMGQLTQAAVLDGRSPHTVNWAEGYTYLKDGNLDKTTDPGTSATRDDLSFNGDLLTTFDPDDAGPTALTWDGNGNMLNTMVASLAWNCDNRLRSATAGANTLALKYDPDGNRVFRSSSLSGGRKYILAQDAGLAVVLVELAPATGGGYQPVKRHYWLHGQIVASEQGLNTTAPSRCFYLADRLGSVRTVLADDGAVLHNYTYEPFGQTLEESSAAGAAANPWRFTSQYYDAEVAQYFLRARQYDPALFRFTARDPVRGSFREPMTLHPYLYCWNDPLNHLDPDGRLLLDMLAAMAERAETEGPSAGAACRAVWMARNFVTALNEYAQIQNLFLQARSLELAVRGMAAVTGAFAKFVAQQGVAGIVGLGTEIATAGRAGYSWAEQMFYMATEGWSRWESADPGATQDVVEFFSQRPGGVPQSGTGMALEMTQELAERIRWEDDWR